MSFPKSSFIAANEYIHCLVLKFCQLSVWPKSNCKKYLKLSCKKAGNFNFKQNNFGKLLVLTIALKLFLIIFKCGRHLLREAAIN